MHIGCNDEEEEWSVTDSKINWAAAADSGDVDTYGTKFGRNVQFLVGVFDAGL